MTKGLATAAERRRTLRHLLDPDTPWDARAAYYAFDHPDSRTTVVVYPDDGGRATGYVCLSRTGLDLFRPLITLRLPATGHDAATTLLRRAVPVGAPVMLSVPLNTYPLIEALFSITSATEMATMVLDRGRFEPVINILVTSAVGPNNLPRYVIRSDDQVVAAANVNWRSARFAEIGVETLAGHRRQGWGRSVVAALSAHLLGEGLTPLYVTAAENQAAIELAHSADFVDLGRNTMFVEGALRPA